MAFTCLGDASAVSERGCCKAGVRSSALLGQVDWPVTWRGSEMMEPKAGALCGGVEGQTQLCLSPLLTGKAQQLRDTGSGPGDLCRAGVGTSGVGRE